jgi:hypothetical protein
MAVCWDFLWFQGLGRSRLGDSTMANVDRFAERGVYARPLVERGVRLLAMGLIVLGTGTIPMGIWTDDVFVVTVGMIGVAAGGAWRLWLAVPDH